MAVTLTDNAARRIVRILSGEPGKSALRIGVAGGGCSGFSYTFDLVADRNADDIAVENQGATVLIDEMSLSFMDGAVIGKNCIVAGHSIVTENAVFPDNSIIAGVPAKVVKTRDSGEANKGNAEWYFQNALRYAKGEDVM